MITVKTVVTVTQDDPKIDEYKKKLADWKMTENTTTVTFVRLQVYGEEK